MTTHPKLRSYQYINRPYDRVRASLHARSSSLLQAATRAASSRADDLASTLRLNAAGFELGVDVHIKVHGVKDEHAAALNSPVTRVHLGWEAAHNKALFPAMDATISAWPLSAHETQIEIDGTYTPPLGAVGQVIDGMIGHRIAEAAVHRFLEDIVEQLRKELHE